MLDWFRKKVESNSRACQRGEFEKLEATSLNSAKKRLFPLFGSKPKSACSRLKMFWNGALKNTGFRVRIAAREDEHLRAEGACRGSWGFRLQFKKILGDCFDGKCVACINAAGNAAK